MLSKAICKYSLAGLLACSTPYALATVVDFTPAPTAIIAPVALDFDTASGTPAPLSLLKFDGTLDSATYDYTGSVTFNLDFNPNLAVGPLQAGNSVTMSATVVLTGPRPGATMTQTKTVEHTFDLENFDCSTDTGGCSNSGIGTKSFIVPFEFADVLIPTSDLALFEGTNDVLFDVSAIANDLILNVEQTNNDVGRPVDDFAVASEGYLASVNLTLNYRFDDNGGSTPPTPVPAPGIAALLGVGLLAFGAARRRMG